MCPYAPAATSTSRRARIRLNALNAFTKPTNARRGRVTIDGTRHDFAKSYEQRVQTDPRHRSRRHLHRALSRRVCSAVLAGIPFPRYRAHPALDFFSAVPRMGDYAHRALPENSPSARKDREMDSRHYRAGRRGRQRLHSESVISRAGRAIQSGIPDTTSYDSIKTIQRADVFVAQNPELPVLFHRAGVFTRGQLDAGGGARVARTPAHGLRRRTRYRTRFSLYAHASRRPF